MPHRKGKKQTPQAVITQLRQHVAGLEELRVEMDKEFDQIRNEQFAASRELDGLKRRLVEAQENDKQSRGMTVQALGVLEKVVATFTDTQKTINEALLRLVPKPVEHPVSTSSTHFVPMPVAVAARSVPSAPVADQGHRPCDE